MFTDVFMEDVIKSGPGGGGCSYPMKDSMCMGLGIEYIHHPSGAAHLPNIFENDSIYGQLRFRKLSLQVDKLAFVCTYFTILHN